jgi:hypothetical protein
METRILMGGPLPKALNLNSRKDEESKQSVEE